MYTSCPNQRGVSLIELIMFIMIISVAVAGLMLMVNNSAGHSADTLLRKRALAVAESLLEEVESMPFTYCDPNDSYAASATGAVLGAQGVGCSLSKYIITSTPTAAQGFTRYGSSYFNNVVDYNGFVMNSGSSGILDISSSVIANNFGSDTLYGFSAIISAVPLALGSIAATDSNGAPQSLLVTVNVTWPSSASGVVLQGYRTRYAPNLF